jgi:hypothetical protein
VFNGKTMVFGDNHRTGKRHVGVLGTLIFLHPFKPIFFKYLLNSSAYFQFIPAVF